MFRHDKKNNRINRTKQITDKDPREHAKSLFETAQKSEEEKEPAALIITFYESALRTLVELPSDENNMKSAEDYRNIAIYALAAINACVSTSSKKHEVRISHLFETAISHLRFICNSPLAESSDFLAISSCYYRQAKIDASLALRERARDSYLHASNFFQKINPSSLTTQEKEKYEKLEQKLEEKQVSPTFS